MENSLLIQTISRFSAQERQEIKEFLSIRWIYEENSRHHSGQIFNLFIQINEYIDEKKVDNLSKKTLLTDLASRFPTQRKPSDNHLNNLMTELMTQLGKYIFIKYNDSKPHRTLNHARFYQERGLNNRAFQYLERIPNQLKEMPALSQDSLLLKFWYEVELFKLQNAQSAGPQDFNLNQCLTSLTNFYANELFYHVSMHIQLKNLGSEDISEWVSFVSDFRIGLAKAGILLPGQDVYDAALNLLLFPSSNPLESLKKYQEALLKYGDLFPEDIIKSLATYARNFCVRNMSFDLEAMKIQQFLLYESHLKRGWLYESGFLHYSTAVNMVTIGLRLNQYQWVRQFLDEHRSNISQDNQGVIFAFCEANYDFYIGDFKKANTFKPKTSNMPDDVRIEKIMRILRIKIAYESGLEPEDEVKAFRDFFKRNHKNLSLDKKEESKKFAIFVLKLFKARFDSNQKIEVDTLLYKIKSEPFLAEREWLEKKAVEIQTIQKRKR